MKLLASICLALLPVTAVSALAADPPAVHGMLVMGKSQIYLSHLPMFHSPHDYQVIWQAELSSAARLAYEESLSLFPGETVYTLVPERFSLPSMVARPREFRAQLFRGHFERGGTPVTGSFVVRPGKLVVFQKLHPEGNEKPGRDYYLFGEPGEAFLVHRIGGRPSFDHVLAVGTGESVTTMPRTLKLGESDEPLSAASLREHAPPDLSLRHEGELYLEFNDLRH